MVNIRSKGAKAELEWIKRFQPFFPNKLDRNLEQTRYGGSDIAGASPFAIEIKRVEDCGIGNKNTWWAQISRSVTDKPLIPVVCFRPSRSEWRALLPASLVVPSSGEWMEVSETLFVQYVLSVNSEYRF